jgi:2'-5' RNA ligase
MRLFIAILLADSVVARLNDLIAALRPRADLRWSAPESWHITLQFLGNSSAEQFDCLVGRLGEVRSAPVPVQLGGLGVFERAGILHAEVKLSEQLMDLQKKIVAATGLCGFEPETRPYRPHITLARFKGTGRSRELSALASRIQSQPKFPRFTASEFLLYESRLLPAGSTYEVRQRFALSDAS